MSNKVKSPLMKKAPTYSLRASIISILIGLLTGAVVILIVGELDPKTTTQEELGLYMAGAKRDEVKA